MRSQSATPGSQHSAEFKPQNVANLMWALAVIACEEWACDSVWLSAILLLVPALSLKQGPLPLTLRASEAAGLSQLHQVLLCSALEGLWPGLDLAGLVGQETVGLCRRAFEGAAVRSSKLQVGPG